MSGQPPGSSSNNPPRPQGYGIRPSGYATPGQQLGRGGPPGVRPGGIRPGPAHGPPGSAGGSPFGSGPRPGGGTNGLQSRSSSGFGASQGSATLQQGPPGGGSYPPRQPSGVAGGLQGQPSGPMANGIGPPPQPFGPPGGAPPSSGPSQQQQQQPSAFAPGQVPQRPQQQPGFSQQPQYPPQQQQQPGQYGQPPIGQHLPQQGLPAGGPPAMQQGPGQMGGRPLMQQQARAPAPRGPPGYQPSMRPGAPPGGQYGRPPAPGGPPRLPGGLAPPGSGAYGSGPQQFGGPHGAPPPYGPPPPQQSMPSQQSIPSQATMPAFGAPKAPPTFGAGAPPAVGTPRGPPPGSGFGGGIPRPPTPGGFGGSGSFDTQTAGLAAQFEQLALGQGQNPIPGQPPDTGPDFAGFPRPIGPEAAAGEAPVPVDHHSCDPGYLRPTTNCVPNSTALRSRWHLPLGIIVHPLNSTARPVPVSHTDSSGIVRCKRCRTYINPFVTWTDGGRRFSCNVCEQSNDVPSDYFGAIDMATGRRMDEARRPELSGGSVEYVAPQEYMVRAPMPPVYFFMVDVSAAAVASGVLPVVCSTIKAALDSLPGDERTLIGFMTYDAHVHFYNLKASLATPKMVVMSDVEDPFVPLPDDLLVNLADSRAVVETLLDTLPASFASNSKTDSALGPALQTAFLVMAGIGGKLLVFQSTPPSVGVARIKDRDNPAAYGTDREALTRKPDDPFFKKYSAEASRVQIAVDIFCMAKQYTDIASLGPLSHYTCGQVYFYPGFHAARDSAKLRAELTHNLTRETGWEAVMRVRSSRGLRISSFHGPFFVRSTDLLALPQVDPDKAFAVQLVLEDNVVNSRVSYVQCALLYTNSNGERRIRVHTMALPVVSDLAPLYASADQGAIAALLAKLSVERMLHRKLDEVRADMQLRVMQALKEFRMLHTPGFRAHHRIIWPTSLRMLPLYILGLTKCSAFRGGQRDVAVDDRMAVALFIQGAGVEDILRLAYPTLLTLHDPSRGLTGGWGGTNDAGQFLLPPALSLETQQLSSGGVYLLDNGRLLLLWLGRNVTADYVAQLFGVPVNELPNDIENLALEPAKDTAESQRFNRLLEKLREGRAVYQQVFIVRQGAALEQRMAAYLVEDGSAGGPGYLDFLLQLHKEILSSKSK